MLRRVLLLSLVVALAPGCSTVSKVKGWFGGGKSKADAPAELVPIASPIAVRELWSAKLGNGERKMWLRQHPVLEGDRIYAVNDDGDVLAFDASSGKTLWSGRAVDVQRSGSMWTFWKSRMAESGLTSSPGVGNGMVVVGGRNGDVVALDAGSGAMRWAVKVTSEVLSAPLVLSDMVVVRSNDGRVFGLNPADGSRKWVFDRGLPTLTVRGNSAPVGSGGLVYIGYDDGSMVALRATDGLRVWEQVVAEPEGRTELERMADIDGEILVDSGQVYAVSYHDQLLVMSADNGRPIWNRDIGSYDGLAMTADKLLVSDKAGNVIAIDRASGNTLWKQDALARRVLTTPVVQGDFAVVGDLKGYLHWLRLDTGEIVGRTRLQRAALRGTPQVSSAGVLYALSNEGRLAAYQLGN